MQLMIYLFTDKQFASNQNSIRKFMEQLNCKWEKYQKEISAVKMQFLSTAFSIF